jgi:site-specific DNA-methyltransferase (adenine-specific)
MRALVEAFTDQTELILDPFAGVGTTAVVARQTGRRFLGWEINPAYHARALARVANAREQLALEWGHG